MKEITAGPRYKLPVSSKELQRRRDAVQAAMKAKDVDMIVANVHSDIFDNYIRYFIDQPAHHYSTTLLIPAEGDLIIIQHGDTNDNMPLFPWARGVEKIVARPFCQPFDFTYYDASTVAVAEIKKRGCKKVGLLGLNLMSAAFYKGVTAGLEGIELVDFSNDVDEIIAVKSDEEKVLLDKCVRAHEKLIAAVPALLYPGRREHEIRSDILHLASDMGCDYMGNLGVGSAKPGEPCMFQQHFNGNRVLEEGDNITIMIEAAGPGGMYGELCRTWTLGKPDEGLKKAWKLGFDIQAELAKNMLPGVKACKINALYNKLCADAGLPENKRYFGHGQGYDMMERPAFSDREQMAFKKDMFVAIHPEFRTATDFVCACDNFIITDEGAVRMTRTAQEVFEVEL